MVYCIRPHGFGAFVKGFIQTNIDRVDSFTFLDGNSAIVVYHLNGVWTFPWRRAELGKIVPCCPEHFIALSVAIEHCDLFSR